MRVVFDGKEKPFPKKGRKCNSENRNSYHLGSFYVCLTTLKCCFVHFNIILWNGYSESWIATLPLRHLQVSGSYCLPGLHSLGVQSEKKCRISCRIVPVKNSKTQINKKNTDIRLPQHIPTHFHTDFLDSNTDSILIFNETFLLIGGLPLIQEQDVSSKILLRWQGNGMHSGNKLKSFHAVWNFQNSQVHILFSYYFIIWINGYSHVLATFVKGQKIRFF